MEGGGGREEGGAGEGGGRRAHAQPEALLLRLRIDAGAIELEMDAESNRIEAAGRITSSAGEIRPRGSSSSSRRRSGIGRRRAEALLTREDGGAPQPRRPRGNLDLRAPALPRLRWIGPAPPLPDPPPPPNRAR
jgi:hypothetical protein